MLKDVYNSMRYKKILIFFFISILTISFLLSHNCSKITNNTKTDSKLLKTDLIEFIHALSHSDSKYVVPDSTRQTGFLALLNSILDAIEKNITSSNNQDWCSIEQNTLSGYGIKRIFDTESKHWFIYAWDITGDGQLYLFFNPQAKRNMIIEVPHSRNYTGSSAEDYTAREGGRIFKDLAARALLINGATRCAIADHSDCDGTTDQCGAAEEKNRRSDLSHEVQTLFQITHQKYNDRYASRVVQLHGKAEGEARAIVGDGTISDLRESSVAVLFAQALAASLGARVDACQDAGSPERPLCGETNVQARYTNNPTGNVCTTGTSSYTGRFLHIEQDRQLGDSPTWQSVSNGIKTTWPQSCDLPGADSDCTLGSAQSESQVLECAVTN